MAEQMERKKLFKEEYKAGEYVAIVRAEHGWHNCRTSGKIIRLEDKFCIVLGDDGYEYKINHPRDLRKI